MQVINNVVYYILHNIYVCVCTHHSFIFQRNFIKKFIKDSQPHIKLNNI